MVVGSAIVDEGVSVAICRVEGELVGVTDEAQPHRTIIKIKDAIEQSLFL